MILYLDTETTAIRPGQIAQLAYILDDGGRLRAKNFWFSVRGIDPASAAVNGLTVEKLAALSGGGVFADAAGEIGADLRAARALVAHNANFDLCFLRTEFARLGVSLPRLQAFDTMTAFTPICRLRRANHPSYKYPKLSELTEFIRLGPADLAGAARLFGAAEAFHDARFDAYAVYLAAARIGDYDRELADRLAYWRAAGA